MPKPTVDPTALVDELLEDGEFIALLNNAERGAYDWEPRRLGQTVLAFIEAKRERRENELRELRNEMAETGRAS